MNRDLLVRGNVYTMGDAVSSARSFVVREGRIAAVGDPEELASAFPGADFADFGERTIIPGFVDAHCHLELTTTHLKYAVKCFAPPHRSLAEICDTLARYARENPGEGWIVGRADFGLHQFVEERRPLTRADLDAAVPHRPVVVYSGLHVSTLNSCAIEMSGLGDGRLPLGSTLDLASGRGLELWHVLPRPAFGPDGTASAIAELGREMFLSRGVTTVADIVASSDGVRAYQILARERRLPFRADIRYHSPTVASAAEIAHLGIESGFGDDWVRFGGLKLFVDGAGHDLDGNTLVDLKWGQEELDEEVGRAHRAGLQLMMHVQSREAIEMALCAVERAVAVAPRDDHRHRLEHAGDMALDAGLLERIRQLGVVIVATPQFIYSYADAKPDVNCAPLRTLHEWGFRIPGNSDSTGSQPEAANPFHGVWCAIARRTRLGATIGPSESISLEAALRMFTADAAYACHLDDRGVIEAGRLADFVVLDEDPYEVETDVLPQLRVRAVFIGGERFYGDGI